jgi:hypothetical protein
MNKGFIIFEETWEYKWLGEEPAPQFPTFRFLAIYLTRRGIKEFPYRLYNVLRRFLTSSLKLSQVPSSKFGNHSGSKAPASRISKETL